MQFRRGCVTGRQPAIVLCAVLAVLAPAVAWSAAASVRILAHEPFQPIPEAAVAGARKALNHSVTRLKFDAFGRRFVLTLEKNPRLTDLADTANNADPDLSLYRGVLESVPGSWVRLSTKAQTIRGMVWDGRELYLIDSANVLESAGTDSVPTDDNIIFRLADTWIEPGGSFCGSTTGSAKEAYSSLLNELKTSPAFMRAPGATLRLEVSALGDALFRARYSSDQQASDEILTRLNNIDGIFSSQLGIEIQVPTLHVDDAIAAQLSATTSASTLIDDLAALRERTPALRTRGLTHLFTGRDLDGNTVGIAYTGTLCDNRHSAGLTQIGRSSGIDSLVAAHEIGHNFGAIHDGEAQCANTPVDQYLMSPTVSENATSFSQCSLDAILPRIESASCLLPLAPPDLSIAADLGTRIAAAGRPFSWELPITNVGGSTAEAASVVLLVPPVVTIDEAWVAGGTCTSGAGVIACEMGAIAAAGVRVIQLTLRSDVIGSNSISARVATLNDSRSSNNLGDGTLIITPEIDLAVSLQGPAAINTGAIATLTFSAMNLTSLDASGITVQVTFPAGLSPVAVQLSDASCEIDTLSLRCRLAALAAGQSASGSMTVSATGIGTATATAVISGSVVDPEPANNSAATSIVLTQQPAVISPVESRRSGGGGFADALLLLAMASLLGLRHARMRS